MKNIHILPTDKPSRLFIDDKILELDYECIISEDDWIKNQHIYITNSEEIKEGDWCIDIEDNTIFKVKEQGYSGLLRSTTDSFVEDSCKKIILTTDQDLIKDGVQPIDDEFLEWFVKNPSCEEVEVGYDKDVFPYGVVKAKGCGWYKTIIPKDEHKQETLEEAAHKMLMDFGIMSVGESINVLNVKKLMVLFAKEQQERSYSEEEMKQAYLDGCKIKLTNIYHLEKWFEQFKKK